MAAQIELPEITKQMTVRQPTTMGLMQIALETGTVDQLQILQEMHFKELARSAEVEFNLAMNAVQSELGRIAPDLNNPQTKSKYASYAALDRVIRPIYTRHGFSLSFDSGDSTIAETVVAFCYVSHSAGHTRKYQSPPMPSDGKGAKGGDVMTKTHATGAAMSYAMRYLLKFIFNIAVGEDDTDGNGEVAEWLKTYFERMANCKSLETLQAVYKEAYRAADERGDTASLQKIVGKMSEEKKRVHKQQQNGGGQ
jgi:hypothetical protein